MRARRHTLALIGLLAVGCRRAPGPADVTLPDPAHVDGAAALARVAELLRISPRDSGTPNARLAAAWIAGRLRAAGCGVVVDAFQDTTPDGVLDFFNVVGVLPAVEAASISELLERDDLPWVLLLSHFDTKSGLGDTFTGANDSGSSTGLLLHLAALYARHPPRDVRIAFAFVDGEECLVAYGPNDGLHGSRRLAGLMTPYRDRVRAVIVLDMIGDRDLQVAIPRNTDRGLRQTVLAAAHAEGVRQVFALANYTLIDDHVPFLDGGMPAICLIDFTYGSTPGANDYWHTEHDTLDKLSADSLALVGRVTVRAVNTLLR